MWQTWWSNGQRTGPRFTLTMPVFTQEYKRGTGEFSGKPDEMVFFWGGGSCPCNRLASYPGGSIANPGYFMLRTQTFLPSNMITSKLRSHVSRTNNF